MYGMKLRKRMKLISIIFHKIGKMSSTEHTKVPKVFFTPRPMGVILNNSYDNRYMAAQLTYKCDIQTDGYDIWLILLLTDVSTNSSYDYR
jgi:hypothetical protein